MVEAEGADSETPLRPARSRSRPDDAEVEAFYGELFPAVVTALCRRGARSHAAEDAAAEAIMLAIDRWAELRDPKAWVHKIAWRILARRTDDGHREVLTAEPETVAVDDFACAVAMQDELDRLRDGLTPSQRQVVDLVLKGYRSAEIAAMTGRSPEAIRSLLTRARQRARLLRVAEAPAVPRQRRAGSESAPVRQEGTDEHA